MGQVAQSLAAKLEAAGLTAEEKLVLAVAVGHHGAAETESEVEGFSMQPGLQGRLKDLEAEDRLGNFEIQDLMSTFNQSETLASSIIGGPLIGTFKA